MSTSGVNKQCQQCPSVGCPALLGPNGKYDHANCGENTDNPMVGSQMITPWYWGSSHFASTHAPLGSCVDMIKMGNMHKMCYFFSVSMVTSSQNEPSESQKKVPN